MHHRIFPIFCRQSPLLHPSQLKSQLRNERVGRMRLVFFGLICEKKFGTTKLNVSDAAQETKRFSTRLRAGIGIGMFSECMCNPRSGKLTFRQMHSLIRSRMFNSLPRRSRSSRHSARPVLIRKGPESVLHSSQPCRRCSNLLRKIFPIFFGWLKPRNPRKHAVLDRNSRVLSVLEKNAPCRLQNPTLSSLKQGSDPISLRLFLTQRQSRRV